MFQIDNDTVVQKGGFCDFYLDRLPWRSVVLLVLCAFGVLGNGAVLLLVPTVRHLRTTTNALILSLAVGDSLLFLLTVPLKVETDIHPCWQFGQALCKVASAGEMVSHGVCVFSLTALSVDRYFSLIRRRESSRPFALVAVPAVWCLALIFGIPSLFLAQQNGYWSCKPLPYFTLSAQAFVTVEFTVMYLVPLIIMTCCYASMARMLIRCRLRGSTSQAQARRQDRESCRLAMVVLLLVFAFGVFWFPHHFYQLWANHRDLASSPSNIMTSLALSNLPFFMTLVNSTINPYAVLVISAPFRRALLSCLGCRCISGPESRPNPAETVQTAASQEGHTTRSTLEVELSV